MVIETGIGIVRTGEDQKTKTSAIGRIEGKAKTRVVLDHQSPGLSVIRSSQKTDTDMFLRLRREVRRSLMLSGMAERGLQVDLGTRGLRATGLSRVTGLWIGERLKREGGRERWKEQRECRRN
jgi:hypothetical protein